MRVLIIGPGYVGLALGKELAQRGHEVFGLRRSGDASGELQAAGIHPLVGDITRPETLLDLPSQFDWVVNCVSSSYGGADDYRRVYLRSSTSSTAIQAEAGGPVPGQGSGAPRSAAGFC